MEIFINEVAERHANENIIMVLDGAGWHRSKRFELPDNMRLHFLRVCKSNCVNLV